MTILTELIMDIFLWFLQAGLAVFFAFTGMGKLRISKRQLIEEGKIAAGSSDIPVRVIGSLELLGSFGLIFPMLLNIFPVLTPTAAIGFCVVMIGAFAVHYSKKEFKVLPLLLAIFVLSAVVAWYRF